MWMARAAGPAAGMTVPQMAIVAVAAIGMFVAVMLLVRGMSRRPARPAPGHRLRPGTIHNRRTSQDRTARAGSFGYGPPSPWRDVPDDPRGWR
jgi:hypothetical protein